MRDDVGACMLEMVRGVLTCLGEDSTLQRVKYLNVVRNVYAINQSVVCAYLKRE